MHWMISPWMIATSADGGWKWLDFEWSHRADYSWCLHCFFSGPLLCSITMVACSWECHGCYMFFIFFHQGKFRRISCAYFTISIVLQACLSMSTLRGRFMHHSFPVDQCGIPLSCNFFHLLMLLVVCIGRGSQGRDGLEGWFYSQSAEKEPRKIAKWWSQTCGAK